MRTSHAHKSAHNYGFISLLRVNSGRFSKCATQYVFIKRLISDGTARPWSLFQSHLSHFCTVYNEIASRKPRKKKKRKEKNWCLTDLFEMWMWQAENWMDFFFDFTRLWTFNKQFIMDWPSRVFGSINFWFQSCNNWFIKIQTRRNWSRCLVCSLSLPLCVLLRTRQLYDCNDHSVGHARAHA